MRNITLSTVHTPDQMRAAARDLVIKADALEASTLQEAGTRFWDIPSYGSGKAEGILIEHHEVGRLVEYRVVPMTDLNPVGKEWDSNDGEPKKYRVYPPECVFKSIAAVSLVSKLAESKARSIFTTFIASIPRLSCSPG